MLQTWVTDGLVPADEATVSVFDRGFRAGEGVFETLRSYHGHVFRLAAHLDRARAGASTLGFRMPDDDLLRRAVTTTATANLDALSGGDAALRLTVTPGPVDPASAFPGTPVDGCTLVVTAQPLRLPERLYVEGITARTVPTSRELPQVKAVSYLAASMANASARAHGDDEALLTDRAGHVLEGAASNVFAVRDGRLVTPPVSAGILAGVTRAVTVELAAHLGLDLTERPVTLAELQQADEVFITATTREIVPVVRIDGAPIDTGRPGPVARRLHAAYRAAVDAEIAEASNAR